jgi:hypothetical protein
MEKMPQLPFFFILGRPRTGTTLIRSLLDAHPNVIIPWECQFILNLYPKYGKLEHWNAETLEDFHADLLDQWQFRTWNLDHEKLKADLLANEGNVSYAYLCQLVYMNQISFYPKQTIRMIGDKNPGYSIYPDRLKKIYPDAKFIYIHRDYRDNFHSIKNVDFELPIVSVVVYKWKYFYKQALLASKKYPGSFAFIRYEDLVSEPEARFREICEFLDIPYVPECFDFYKMKHKAEETYPVTILKKHHKSLFNPVNTSRIGLWKNSMSDRQVKIADLVAGKYAEQAGYERKYKGFNLWIGLLALPGVCYARFLYIMTSIIDHTPYRFRQKILSKGPLLIARIFGKLFPKKPATV